MAVWTKFYTLITFTALISFGILLDQKQDAPVRFSSIHGPKAEILNNSTIAQRYEGGCWAVCLTDSSIKVNRHVTFRITETEPGWLGNLNVGVLYTDPFYLPMGALVICDPNITNSLNNTQAFIFQEFYNVNNTYTFYVDETGDAKMTLWNDTFSVVFSHVDVKKPFWMLFNIYGKTKAVELL